MNRDYSVDGQIQSEEPKEEKQHKFHLFGKMTAKDKMDDSKKSLIQKIGIQNLCILLVLGILLVFLWYQDDSGTKKDNKKSSSETKTASETLDANPIYAETESETEEYVEYLEQKLKDILSKVDGIGDVDVMITLSESKELVTLKDTPYTKESVNEDDGEGGSRVSESYSQEEETVMSTTDDGETSPYIIKEIQPTISGILVLAEGGDNTDLKLEITEAVEALFDLPVHKIKVMAMGSGK